MRRKLSHAQIIALGFLLVILAGTLLLLLPASSKSGESAGFLTAFFTAVSASCVTGLVVVDTGTYWSALGQVVILVMIQIGGLGFMTISTLFFRLIRRRVSMQEKAVMAESINSVQIGRIMTLTRLIGTGTLIIELVGAALLALRFVPQLGPGRGLWFALFHSVSAFCNAGFDLLGSVYRPFCSFVPYSADALVALTLSALIVIGGIGFLVWDDVLRHFRDPRRYMLHTKVTLAFTRILIIGGALLFFIFERRGMNADMPLGKQLLVSLFSAVTPRTAGFNTVDTAALSPASRLLTMMLMFIGGSSGSTAGGVKTTTAAVLLMSLIAMIRGRRCVYVYGRRIPDDALKRAACITSVNLLLALAGALVILGAQPLAFSDILFEVFSAIGTVGMSTGVTRSLAPLSLCVISLLMFCGRVGSVSFALALLERRAEPPVTYPEEQITVG